MSSLTAGGAITDVVAGPVLLCLWVLPSSRQCFDLISLLPGHVKTGLELNKAEAVVRNWGSEERKA